MIFERYEKENGGRDRENHGAPGGWRPIFFVGIRIPGGEIRLPTGNRNGNSAIPYAFIAESFTMKLAQLLTPSQILLDLKADSHWASIVELVDGLVGCGKLPADQREESLVSLRAREDQVSTGIGAGVAIPHTFSDDLEEVVAIFGRSERGIDFEALDQKLVHLIILFIVPRKDYHLHLRTLAAIAKMFTNADVRQQLLAVSSAAEVLAILDSRPSRASSLGR